MRLLLWSIVALAACASPDKNVPLKEAKKTQPSTGSKPAVEEAKASAMELSIVFHPGFTSNIGWAKLPTPLPMSHLGNPGASTANLHNSYDDTLRFHELLGKEIEDTSIVLSEAALCAGQFADIIGRAHPRRLLLAIRGGIGSKGIECLEALDVRELYIAGCLYRSHRSEEKCNGDAELEALAAAESLRPRIRGLALSLSRTASLRSLQSFPKLTYLALVAGNAPAPGLGFYALPFNGLKELRYLRLIDHVGYPSVSPDGPVVGEAARFVGQLHTLAWKGSFPEIARCEIRRLRMGSIGEQDLNHISSCTRLSELSTDSPDFNDVAPIGGLTELETLSVTHLSASSLAPLAKLTKLQRLEIVFAEAEDFAFLTQLHRLRHLNLSGTSIASTELLSHLAELRTLDISSTQIRSILPLKKISGLTKLDISDTRASDISPVAALGALVELNIATTPVNDIAALKSHPSLEWVILRKTQVSDAGVLLTMPKLRRAHIGGLALPEAQVSKLKKKLDDLDDF